jgi:hypothetical protein
MVERLSQDGPDEYACLRLEQDCGTADEAARARSRTEPPYYRRQRRDILLDQECTSVSLVCSITRTMWTRRVPSRETFVSLES